MGDVTVGGIALLDTIRNSLTSVVVDDSLTVTGLATIAGDVAVNGGDLTTTQTTFALLNVTPTTINAFGAATTISMGALTGTTTINNDLIVGDELIVNGTGTSSFAGPISGTTVTASSYGIFGGGDIVVASGGMAKIIIDGADATETNAENAIFEKTANLNYTSRASHIFVIDNDANESNRTFSIRADSVESSDIFTLSKAGALTVAAGLSGTTVTMTGSLDVDGDVADTSAFTTTATRAAVYIAGALSTDKYTVSHRNASGTETLPVADDQMSYYAKADSLIVLRQAGTTSGLKFSYSRFK